jgi:very-short-patch-repair endonuclease
MDKRARANAARTKLENLLATKMTADGLPTPEREFKFATRRWRSDFAWPAHMLLVEVEGGTHVNGRHNRPQGYEDDCEKYDEATLLGWRVLRFTGRQVRNGYAVRTIRAALDTGRTLADSD